MNNYRPKPGSNTDKLVQAIQKSLVSLRTGQLVKATGVAAGSIQACLEIPIRYGLVSACKVTKPEGGHAEMEYKTGPGLPRLGDEPLKSALAGRPVIPVRESASSAQPAVASNTGSPRDFVSLQQHLEPARAVAQQAAPAIHHSHGSPAPGNVNRSGTLGFSIDDGAELTIYMNDGMSDPLVLDAAETMALGDFMHCTEALWRP